MKERYIDYCFDINKSNNKILFKILSNLVKIEDGLFLNENNKIIKKTTNNGYDINIENKNIKFNVSIYYDGKYGYDINIDPNTTLYQSIRCNGIEYKWIHTKNNNNEYNIYDYGISKKHEQILLIKDNILIKKLNHNTIIGYNFENDKIYIYYKKYGKEDNISDNLYIKYEYNDLFNKELEDFNAKILLSTNNLKEDTKDNRFNNILDNFNIRLLDNNLEKEIEDLKNIVSIYNKYKDKFDILENNENLNDIYDFTNTIINEPVITRENNIKSIINNLDLGDTNSLKSLQSEINNLLKYKKKQKRKIK